MQQGEGAALWDEPYLETCCRAALHRLHLAGSTGRPGGLKDGPCLERLQGLGFAAWRPDGRPDGQPDGQPGGRFDITEAGRARHTSEVMGGKTAGDEAAAPTPAHRG